MINQRQIKYFLAIIDNGSFRKAALKLSITQSTISLAIKNLENYLGQPLFIRQQNQTILTEYGLKFLDFAKQFNKDLLVLKKDFKTINPQTVPLKIGIVNQQLDAVLGLFKLFIEQNIPFILSEDTGYNLRQNLKKGLFDIIISIALDSEELLINYPDENNYFLLKDKLVLITNKTYLKTKTFKDFKELANYPFIVTTGTKNYLEEIFDENNLELNILAEVSTARIIPNLIKQTKAISLLSYQSIAPSFYTELNFIQCTGLINSNFRIQATVQPKKEVGNYEARLKAINLIKSFAKQKTN